MNTKKHKVFYWSPSLVDIATNRSVINSAYSLNKYSKKYCCSIINFFENLIDLTRILKKKKLLNYYNNIFIEFYQDMEKKRIFFFNYIFNGFFPLKNCLKKKHQIISLFI